MRGPAKPNGSGNNPRQVNNLLHTLRGEHFRHVRNQNSAPAARAPSYATPSKQTLPISQIFGDEADATRSDGEEVHELPGRQSPLENRNKPAWRKQALALLFSQTPLRANAADLPPTDENDDEPDSDELRRDVPPLTELCLRALLAYCRGSQFAEVLVPYLPPHLRRLLLRWTAVNSPLSNSKLYALCDSELGGHTDGELIVVGPQASLPINYFKTVNSKSEPEEADGHPPPPGDVLLNEGDSSGSDDNSWESASSTKDELSPLLCLSLVSTPLPAPTLFTLPPTLTHLALLSLPTLTPIHRLPRILPLLEVLDLSYNLWLGQPKIISDAERRGENLLERTEWGRWSRLRVLGLRECGASKDIIKRVNEGRWADVEVIGLGGLSSV